jgi:hypothetical protein
MCPTYVVAFNNQRTLERPSDGARDLMERLESSPLLFSFLQMNSGEN